MSVFEELASTADRRVRFLDDDPKYREGNDDGANGHIFEQDLQTILSKSTASSAHRAALRHVLELAVTPGRPRDTLIGLRGTHAERILTVMQTWLDETDVRNTLHRPVFYLLFRIASASMQLPASLYLTGIDIGKRRDARRMGGFADVYKGVYRDRPVALKKLRVTDWTDRRVELHKLICREALVWRQLNHPNVLPFIGLDVRTFQDTDCICMVSPWMDHGTVIEFMQSDKYNAPVDRNRLFIEIAKGLKYLHSQHIVHADIRGANILVDDSGHALLSDFGLIVVGDATIGRWTTTHSMAGTVQWTSPERIQAYAESVPPPRRTFAEDIYAYGCLCIEMITGEPPFRGLPDTAVQFKVYRGESPQRPTTDRCRGCPVSDDLWATIERCLSRKPGDRPPASTIISELAALSVDHAKEKQTTGTTEPPVRLPKKSGITQAQDSTLSLMDLYKALAPSEQDKFIAQLTGDSSKLQTPAVRSNNHENTVYYSADTPSATRTERAIDTARLGAASYPYDSSPATIIIVPPNLETETDLRARKKTRVPRPSPDRRSPPKAEDPHISQLRELLSKLEQAFPEDAASLSQVHLNPTRKNGIVDPRSSSSPGAAMFHVFIDHSNILFALLNCARAQSYKSDPTRAQTYRTDPTERLLNAALILLMERGRSITRRVITSGQTLYQSLEWAEPLGYQVHFHVPAPHSKPPGGATVGPPSGLFKYREPGASDLLLQKVYEAIGGMTEPSLGSTIALAYGDGREGQFWSEFRNCALAALRKGWKVEVYACDKGLSDHWKKDFAHPWLANGALRVIELEDYLSELMY